ncbi:amidohydrolase family protein [Pedobacter sandarakinus]|uniref:amidohydrolase family protein n=1 Tax=Pedobacter sandarakinus TaxID=353156 RepID=UPI0022454865|nr:amidohydrolase family protein [Pedobacter sandarakinus]MCX2576340.1 amidohydrolase family protein [Pedobacter sandarakinus]
MLKYFSADWVFPVTAPAIKNGIIGVNHAGEIVEVSTQETTNAAKNEIITYSGAIVPGFINTHCHLELSHMLGKISKRTGLVNFVQAVISNRHSNADEQLRAMEAADLQMFENGIVAVGDISNEIGSKLIKQRSNIYYHTFVEAMGFNPKNAFLVMDGALRVREGFLPLPVSVTAHAPYSVSGELFNLINSRAEQEGAILSVHNQETKDENDFFISKTGGFLNLYQFLELDIAFFSPAGKSSLQTWLPHIKKQKTLLVHNTVTDQEDINFSRRMHPDLFWCLCPQANLYIEDALPDVDLLIAEGVKITLGTDSLASNHQLNILAEMKTLQDRKQVNFELMLQWATQNGAKFLGVDGQFGSLSIGKKPGLNLVQLSTDFSIQSDKVIKLI